MYLPSATVSIPIIIVMIISFNFDGPVTARNAVSRFCLSLFVALDPMVGKSHRTHFNQKSLEVWVIIRLETCLQKQPSKSRTCHSNMFAPKLAQRHNLLPDIPMTIYQYRGRIFLWIIFDTHIPFNLAKLDVAESVCHLPP